MSARSISNRFRRVNVRAAALNTILLVGVILEISLPSLHAANRDLIRWNPLPPLSDSLGFAGSFAGVNEDALLVAGGANFPGGPPWTGAEKTWHDRIFILAQPGGIWKQAAERLPRPLAYGVAITTGQGVLCLGGSDARRHYPDVFFLNQTDGKVQIRPGPSLPGPLANACGALLGQTVYVAGGLAAPTATQTLNVFWALDLSEAEPHWNELAPWPGRPRMLAVAGVQDGAFYLFSGTDLHPGPDGKPVREYLRDAYRFKPDQGWKRLADLPRPAVAAPSPAWTVGQSHLLIVGGDDGEQASRSLELKDAHPGFSGDVLGYHTITDTWTVLGRFPKRPGPDPRAHPEQADWPAVTTSAVAWNGSYVAPGGEIRPGVRTPKVWSARIEPRSAAFGLLNFVVLSAYLAGMVLIGVYFARKNRDTDDYFRGGKQIPWLVAGLSIFATMLSSLTYMSVPAKAYATNWEYLVGYPFILLTAALVVWLVLPFFRGIDATSAYEYLERRFNRPTRLLGSGLFLFFQAGRMAIVLFLSALALKSIMGLPVGQCILLMGTLSILYCTLGGVEAVVWTDAVQAVVLLAGAVLSLGLVLASLPGGLGQFFEVASTGHKFHMINWNWDAGSYAGAAFWVLALGALGQNLVSYTSDQAVVQRYMTTATQPLAARSIWTNGIMALPAGLLFFLLGTSLYVFYKTRPERLDPTFATDAIFPLFITRELPAGLAGLVVAGIFAAAQSTISTSMNSMATAFVTDFCRPFRLVTGEAGYLRLARWATLVAGLAGTLLALVFSSGNIKSLLDKFFAVLGLFGGSLGGVFLLGMFTRRANAGGAMTGAILGAVVTYYVQNFTRTHVYLHAAIGMATCFTTGWLASGLFPNSARDTAGLTIHTRLPKGQASETEREAEV
jgi:solute:Na+ symporter, SSS family